MLCNMGKKKKKTKTISVYSTEYAKLGKRIKELRKQKGYTSSLKFAFDNGFSHIQMARWEKGNNISFESMLRLSEAFNISVGELLKDI